MQFTVQKQYPDSICRTPEICTGKSFKFVRPLKPIFKLLSKPYSKKISVFKKDNPKPTDTIGYEFDFEITAPPEFLRIGYYAGFGVKNANGFGFCEILKN